MPCHDRLHASRKFNSHLRATALGAFAIVSLTGCLAAHVPENRERVTNGRSYQVEYRVRETNTSATSNDGAGDALPTATSTIDFDPESCTTDIRLEDLKRKHRRATTSDHRLLSRGDLLGVAVAGDETFSGQFEVDQAGLIHAPYLKAIPAVGVSVSQLELSYRHALLDAGHYQGAAPDVSVRVLEQAAVSIFVSGAVYEPGVVLLNAKGERNDEIRQAAIGDFALDRRASVALRRSGGVRPDANVREVTVLRQGRVHILDLTALIRGESANDMLLVDGNQVYVPSKGCFDRTLVRPTPVTPPGIKVFMSNLTQPASSNSQSSIDKDSREIKYGTRFLQALVGMNCVGGTQTTNSDRFAVLISRNPVTKNSIVIERRIEDLVRQADRDDYDPYLLPGDAIACYDSGITNINDVAGFLGRLLGVFRIFGG